PTPQSLPAEGRLEPETADAKAFANFDRCRNRDERPVEPNPSVCAAQNRSAEPFLERRWPRPVRGSILLQTARSRLAENSRWQTYARRISCNSFAAIL